MTENTEQTTQQTDTVRLIGQEAIDYAAAGHDTRLKFAGREGLGIFIPAMDDVSAEKAAEMVDEQGADVSLFYCDGDPRIVALGRMLDGDFNDIEEEDYRENYYSVGRQNYYVMTDDEADEAAAERIRESLWAFKTEFISGHTRKGLSDRAEKALAKAQAELCEGANDLVESMIEDMDHFIKDAIRGDGRGHFLSTYDGEEREESVGGTMYFIYREN